MTTDEAIKYLDEMRPRVVHMNNDIIMLRGDALRMAISALEHQKWIPCSERMPEEHETVFAKLKGTNRWNEFMFEKASEKLRVTVEFEDGSREIDYLETIDGEWEKRFNDVKKKVIAWMPNPEPYKESVKK